MNARNARFEVVSVFLVLALFLSSLFFPLTAVALDRIVTLNPMITEWTAEILGKESALKKVVGASEYSNYPDYMKTVRTVGPYPQIHIEDVLSLKPDLVIASSEYNRADQIERLKRLKLNVVVLPKEQFEKMGEWILQLGKALREEKRGQEVANTWDRELSQIQTKTKKKVFFQIQFMPLITVGRDSFLTSAFAKAGYENIFKDMPQSYPKVSREAVLERNPDEVLVFEMIKNQDDLNTVKDAWKKSKVRVLNGDDFARCSLQLLHALKEAIRESK